MSETTETTREDLILKLKEAMCRYTFFHKKMTPEQIYCPIIATKESLISALKVLDIIKEQKKEKEIGYINPLSDGSIKITLENEKDLFSFETGDDGQVSACHTIKNNFIFKTAEETREVICKI